MGLCTRTVGRSVPSRPNASGNNRFAIHSRQRHGLLPCNPERVCRFAEPSVFLAPMVTKYKGKARNHRRLGSCLSARQGHGDEQPPTMAVACLTGKPDVFTQWMKLERTRDEKTGDKFVNGHRMVWLALFGMPLSK